MLCDDIIGYCEVGHFVLVGKKILPCCVHMEGEIFEIMPCDKLHIRDERTLLIDERIIQVTYYYKHVCSLFGVHCSDRYGYGMVMVGMRGFESYCNKNVRIDELISFLHGLKYCTVVSVDCENSTSSSCPS